MLFQINNNNLTGTRQIHQFANFQNKNENFLQKFSKWNILYSYLMKLWEHTLWEHFIFSCTSGLKIKFLFHGPNLRWDTFGNISGAIFELQSLRFSREIKGFRWLIKQNSLNDYCCWFCFWLCVLQLNQ